MRVLVVEDNPDAGATLNALLRLVGHDSRWATDGQAGLDAAKAWQPDVILLDVGLPKLDGYQVAERIRADATLKQPRIWMLTAYVEDAERAILARVDGYLQKPASFTRLKAAIAAAAV